MRNMTGRFRPSFNAGVQMFTTRQSSPGAPSMPLTRSRIIVNSAAPPGTWGAFDPHDVASRTPAHGAGLVGGMNRFFPVVLPPYGTPRNILMPSGDVRPRTLP